MLKKIITIVAILVVLLIIAGAILIPKLLPNQIQLQYEKETQSAYKRSLEFTDYSLDTFSERYSELESLFVEQSIEEIQGAIGEGKITCVELAKCYLYRIQRDERYNTVIELNPFILEEAAKLDEKIQKGEMASLYGTMVLIKDNIADQSMHTSAGAYVLKDLRTTRDAHLVDQLKQEDALILGKANLSEWSNFMSMPSSNGFSVLGGQTKNAYGLFDVGGSSSGSSSSASLNLATVTIGTETSGSLIYPAGQNSVVAIKPTLGLISRDLIIPIAEAQDTAGVIGRSVKDVHKVFSNILAVDEHDEATKIVESFNIKYEIHESEYRRIGVVNAGSPEMEGVIEEFESMGIEVVDVQLGSTEGIDVMGVLNYGIVHDVRMFLENEAVESPVKMLQEVVAFNKSDEEAVPFGQTLLEEALKLETTEAEIQLIIQQNKSISSKIIDDALAQYDVPMLLSISNELSQVYATAGYPALTIPAGYKESGEPFGITLVGSSLDDIKLMEMGLIYESHTNHRLLPDDHIE